MKVKLDMRAPVGEDINALYYEEKLPQLLIDNLK